MSPRLGQLSISLVFICAVAASSCAIGESPSEQPAAERVRDDIRDDALARSAVFRDRVRPELLRAGSDPDELACRFVPIPISGTSPKFTCELPDGTEIKVKYGSTPEVPAELAASRLLRALGFGADHMQLASRVRCFGCPATPFYVRKLADGTPLGGLVRGTPDYGQHRDFSWAAVEQKLEGGSIDGETEGWGFYELDRIDRARGGATPEEVDALRLMAIFLVHWDNKSANQRLTCMTQRDGGRCTKPLVILQDVGATFGPRKVDLDDWRRTPVWADTAGCRVSMESLPHSGGTFPDSVLISDGGRRLLAERLGALSRADVASLFENARFPGRIDDWVNAFAHKTAEIADRSC